MTQRDIWQACNPTGSSDEVREHAAQWEHLRLRPEVFDRRQRLIGLILELDNRISNLEEL